MESRQGPWRVEDLVSPLVKLPKSPSKMEFTLALDSPSSPPPGEHVIPRVLGHCDMCLATETPLWRGGPNGPKSLCNACGLRYSKELKKVKLALGEKPPPKKTVEDEPSAHLALGNEPSPKMAVGGKLSAESKTSTAQKTKRLKKTKSVVEAPWT